MARSLFLRPQAEADVAREYARYESLQPGLGRDFLNEVAACFERIETNPELYQPIYLDLRRALTRRFPFGVFYVLTDERINVLAVLHSARDPGTWRQRR